jgi:putative ABC transport system ATP-binding protein
MKEVLNVNHLKKRYESEDNITIALQDISFAIGEGEFISIMGASGSGKTTLLNCISTIDEATEGEIWINGTELSGLNEEDKAKFRRENLGFIFQDYNLLDTLTVEENISLALIIKQIPKSKIKERVSNISEQFGIQHILKKYPYEISGGEKQRCACVRAVSHWPQLIMADEPTGALDSGNSRILMETIKQLNDSIGTTILIVTHDIIVSSYTDRTLYIKDGRIYEDLNMKGLSADEKLKRLMNLEAEQHTEGGKV